MAVFQILGVIVIRMFYIVGIKIQNSLCLVGIHIHWAVNIHIAWAAIVYYHLCVISQCYLVDINSLNVVCSVCRWRICLCSSIVGRFMQDYISKTSAPIGTLEVKLVCLFWKFYFTDDATTDQLTDWPTDGQGGSLWSYISFNLVGVPYELWLSFTSEISRKLNTWPVLCEAKYQGRIAYCPINAHFLLGYVWTRKPTYFMLCYSTSNHFPPLYLIYPS